MDDLLSRFVRARLDDDQRMAAAHRQHSPSWDFDDAANEIRDALNAGTVAFVPHAADGEHMARHDPARALVEVHAKRRMIDNYEMMLHAAQTEPVPHPEMLAVYEMKAATWHTALRLLALSYADHPDYRPEWAL